MIKGTYERAGKSLLVAFLSMVKKISLVWVSRPTRQAAKMASNTEKSLRKHSAFSIPPFISWSHANGLLSLVAMLWLGFYRRGVERSCSVDNSQTKLKRVLIGLPNGPFKCVVPRTLTPLARSESLIRWVPQCT